MRQPHCIEVATFRLKPVVAGGAPLAIEEPVRKGSIAREPGHLARELAKDASSGEWRLLMRLETRGDVDAWMGKVKALTTHYCESR